MGWAPGVPEGGGPGAGAGRPPAVCRHATPTPAQCPPVDRPRRAQRHGSMAGQSILGGGPRPLRFHARFCHSPRRQAHGGSVGGVGCARHGRAGPPSAHDAHATPPPRSPPAVTVPEERQQDGALARAGAAHQADLQDARAGGEGRERGGSVRGRVLARERQWGRRGVSAGGAGPVGCGVSLGGGGGGRRELQRRVCT